MNNKPASGDCDHPIYPEYREQLGEDPARLVYHMDPVPRVRAIDDPELIRAYLDVETDRDNPRQDVIAACNARLIALEEHESETQRQALVADGGATQ